MYDIERTDEEVDEVLSEAQEAHDEGQTMFPERSYSEGVLNGIRWVLGEEDQHPLTI